MQKRFSIFIVFLAFILCAQAWGVVQEPELLVSPKIAWQGKVLKVRVVSPKGVSWIKGRFLNQDFICYRRGDDFKGIVGVPINQKPGQYKLSLFITYKDGTLSRLDRRIKVWSTKFPFSRYWLKPAKRKLMKRELIDKDWVQIEKVLKVESLLQHWSGKFMRPVGGRISQGFGFRQIVNGKRGGQHRGVDFAVLTGTPVNAPNYGKVVFAKRLRVFGGTIVLDHGQGVHTLYFHLSRLYVKVGQEVPKGKVIGLSGDSGISSGPHLHWGMSVHNLRVDPIQWVKYEI